MKDPTLASLWFRQWIYSWLDNKTKQNREKTVIWNWPFCQWIWFQVVNKGKLLPSNMSMGYKTVSYAQFQSTQQYCGIKVVNIGQLPLPSSPPPPGQTKCVWLIWKSPQTSERTFSFIRIKGIKNYFYFIFLYSKLLKWNNWSVSWSYWLLQYQYV